MVCFKRSMSLHRVACFLALFLILSYVAGAARVSGRIVDEDGIVLPFASVVVKGTTMGTSANAEGYYTLNIPAGSYTLQGQYIGYKQTLFELTLTASQNVQHDFVLKAQGYELKDVVIRSGGEDPAYRIIRNAIKKRSFHNTQMQSFQTSIYLKGVFRNRSNLPNRIMGMKLKEEDKKEMSSGMGLDSGKGVLYLCEQVADYYTSGKKERLIIRSVKESGDPNGVGMGSVPPVINFYENNVNILAGADATYVSPISNSALSSYTFKLIGEFEENGQKIYKIKVTPKRNFERCLLGDIYIADEDWSIHSVRVLASKKQGLDILDTVKIEQQYVPVSKDLWVIKSQVFYPTIKLLGFDFSGNYVTVYDNQKVNQPIADSIFNRKVTVSYQREATKRDSAYWQTLRPMSLESDELRNYDYRDSVYTINNDPVRRDSLRRRANRVSVGDVLWGGISFNGKDYRNSLKISSVLFDVNFNTVEGLNYAPELSFSRKMDTGKVLDIDAGLRYGFSNTHFNGKALVRYTQFDPRLEARRWSIAATGGRYISQFNNAQPVPELLNTYSSLVQQRNYFKIYERWIAGLQFKKAHGNGLSWNVALHYEQRLPLSNTTDFSFVQQQDIQAYTANLPDAFSGMPMTTHSAVIARASVTFQPGVHYTEYPDKKVMRSSKLPVFSLRYQKGIPNLLNSITDYDKWEFQVGDHVSLRRMGSFEFSALVGGFLNAKNVQIPDRKHLLGNQYTLAGPYLQSFQLAPYYLYSNTEKLYGELHLEYYLKGLLTNKLPLFRQAHWYFVLGTNTFYTANKDYYTEAFIGLDNFGFSIFRVLRFDYIRGWDNLKQNYSGFRLGVKLGGSYLSKNNDIFE
ncbi:MAG TPA: DUF5686 and carboxypeptidase regulatory-like domain-containing protein [Chitinophagaceae bacterium]|nr:DUF5686 and carboxypeptidase regulatory-like domain-containing protein [Chitinophagaceae bacterium]